MITEKNQIKNLLPSPWTDRQTCMMTIPLYRRQDNSFIHKLKNDLKIQKHGKFKMDSRIETIRTLGWFCKSTVQQ